MADFCRLLFVLCVSICYVLAKHEEYEGYTLYEVTAKDLEQGAFIRQLENQIQIDIWMVPRPEHPGQIFVSKENKEEFENILTNAGVEYKVAVTDIKEQLDIEEEALAVAKLKKNEKSSNSISFNEVHRYDKVNEWLDRLAREYPNIIKVETAGKSVEGRDIKVAKISTTNFEDKSKPVVVLQSLLHAREWISLPVTLYAIEKLVVNVTETDVLNDIDWVIIPIVNPDGYEWSHTHDRFWRKNRATGYAPGNSCMGVDLNRNFDIFWGTSSSANVCWDTFHGHGPFSEPEARAVQRVLQEHAGRIQMYVDLHSYGSLILYGYGTGQFPPNPFILHLVGVGMATTIDSLKIDWKPDYTVGNVYYLLYGASGTASDYVHWYGVPLSYTFELPAYRNQPFFNGFLVDPNYIEQAGFETFEAIKYGARYAQKNYTPRAVTSQ